MRYVAGLLCLAGAIPLSACTEEKLTGADALAAADCRYWSRCADRFGFPFSGMDGCRRYESGAYRFRADVHAGGIIDEQAVPGCVTSFDTSPCEGADPMASPACRSAIPVQYAQVGELCVNQGCFYSTYFCDVDFRTMCDVGAYCQIEGSGPCGVCAARPAVGEACTFGVECQEGSRCDYDRGLCLPLSGLGEPCHYEPGVCASSYCDSATQTCAVQPPRRPDGDSCTLDWDCRSGICGDGRCTPRRGWGAPCVGDGECALDLACVDGVCSTFDWWRPATAGEVCRWFCAGETWCSNEPVARCRPFTAVGDACSDWLECGFDAYCGGDPRVCLAYKTVGDPCTSDSECSTGRCAGVCVEGDVCAPAGS